MARLVHDDTIIYLCDGNKFADDEGRLQRQDPHALRLTTTTDDTPPGGWYTVLNTNLEPMHFCSFNCLFRRLAYDQLKLGEPVALHPGRVGLAAPIGSLLPSLESSTALPAPTMPSAYASTPSRPNSGTLASMYPHSAPVTTPPASSPSPSSSASWSTGKHYSFSDGIPPHDDEINVIEQGVNGVDGFDVTAVDTTTMDAFRATGETAILDEVPGGQGNGGNTGSASASQSSFPQRTSTSPSAPSRPQTKNKN